MPLTASPESEKNTSTPQTVALTQTDDDNNPPDVNSTIWIIDSETMPTHDNSISVSLDVGTHIITTLYNVGGVQHSGNMTYVVCHIGDCGDNDLCRAQFDSTTQITANTHNSKYEKVVGEANRPRIRYTNTPAQTCLCNHGESVNTITLLSQAILEAITDNDQYGEKAEPVLLIAETNDGKTYQIPGMFMMRDKLPRVGVHKTMTGKPIQGANVIIRGEHGSTVASKTDTRGVWAEYLPIDDYSNTELKSFTDSGKVYMLVEQIERLPDNPYIWDEIMRPVTKSFIGWLMIHKEV